MKMYEKPVVTVDAGMAEGVYAASGSTSSSIFSDGSVIASWSDTSGQVNFNVDLSKLNRSKLTINVTFNHPITNIWGGGASANLNGTSTSAILTWYDAPESATLTAQVATSNPNDLKVISYTISNE